MSRQAPPVNARPECPHGCVYVGLYGEALHMVCGCSPSPAALAAHNALRASGWFRAYDESKK